MNEHVAESSLSQSLEGCSQELTSVKIPVPAKALNPQDEIRRYLKISVIK